MIWYRESFISSSAAVIHSSTAPSVDEDWFHEYPSPSLDLHPLTIFPPRWKSSDLTLSNSLSMCSWMPRGSGDPSTDRSSSSETKKKRGNDARLVSR